MCEKPGPAQDGFNAWAKKHVPGLAIDSLPSTSITGGESAHLGFGDELASIDESSVRPLVSSTSTPSGMGQGLGIENAASAIEGWVRRLAIKGPGTPKLADDLKVRISSNYSMVRAAMTGGVLSLILVACEHRSRD